jgi:hypothetical protein
VLNDIKCLADEHCPGAYCIRNRMDLHTHVAAGERWEAVSTISTMLVVAVFIAMVAVVGLLSWRWRDSPLAPRTCCSLRPWPPDDLTAQRPRL